MKEVFNLEALELGKSYAERAHAAGVGNGVGHGLRCVVCRLVVSAFCDRCSPELKTCRRARVKGATLVFFAWFVNLNVRLPL